MQEKKKTKKIQRKKYNVFCQNCTFHPIILESKLAENKLHLVGEEEVMSLSCDQHTLCAMR